MVAKNGVSLREIERTYFVWDLIHSERRRISSSSEVSDDGNAPKAKKKPPIPPLISQVPGGLQACSLNRTPKAQGVVSTKTTPPISSYNKKNKTSAKGPPVAPKLAAPSTTVTTQPSPTGLRVTSALRNKCPPTSNALELHPISMGSTLSESVSPPDPRTGRNSPKRICDSILESADNADTVCDASGQSPSRSLSSLSAHDNPEDYLGYKSASFSAVDENNPDDPPARGHHKNVKENLRRTSTHRDSQVVNDDAEEGSDSEKETPNVQKKPVKKGIDIVKDIVQIVLKMNTKLQNVLDSIAELRQLMLNRSGMLHQPKGFPKLPIETKDDFLRLEQLVKSQANKEYLLQKLKEAGGKDVKGCVYGVMAKFMKNQVGALFNWAGIGDTLQDSFERLPIKECACKAVTLILGDNCNMKDIEDAMKNWLKFRPFRAPN